MGYDVMLLNALIFTSHMQTELKILKAKKKHQENAVMTELQVGLHAFSLFSEGQSL